MDTSRSSVSSQLSAEDIAAVTLKESFAEVMRYLQLAVDGSGGGDVENIHQLRIVIRRACVALQVFKDFLPRRVALRLQSKLSKIRKRTGPSRDADVFATRLVLECSDPAAEPLIKKLAALRDEGRSALLALYQKWEQGERLERRATEVLCSIHPRRSQASREGEIFGHFAVRRLRSAARQFFAHKDADPRSLKRLHAFRIRVKELRYCLELLRQALPEKQFANTYAQIKKLAQRLGDVTDHAMAITMLERWRCTSEGPTLERLTGMLAKERKALRRAINTFQDWWSGGRPRRLRRRLKKTATQPRVAATMPTSE